MQYLKGKLKLIISIIMVITTISQTNMIQTNSIEGKETNKDVVELTYETDNITVPLVLWSPTGAGLGTPGFLLETNDSIVGTLFLSEHVAINRPIIFTLIWRYGNGLVIDGELSLWRNPSDGLSGTTTIEDAINHDVTFGAVTTYIETTYTLATINLVSDCIYRIAWVNVDASSIYVVSIQADYLVKRSLPT